ncbi:MAG TPA: zinc ribbon domain-containing protein [Candidatus Omnitrophota bacterium]|nr:zinc ribbon domain-containing protein [Candidatus Omnitrophota bacterium]HQO58401.1 zinc ribbon domain-containing protein [Candidatus Omnitrophota bacterium]HQP11704.1 zinc ribbon domain-containing protein [Candidatus Omnitrophota bacterium]
MPTYQYECAHCGDQMEIMQAITDAKLTRCPQCGQDSLQRLIGAGSGIIFKGNGFFETDYKRQPAPQKCPREGGKTSSCSCPCDGAC